MASTPPLWMGLVFGLLFLLPGLGLLVTASRRGRKAVTALRARSTSVADLSPDDLATVEGEVLARTDERAPTHFLTDTDGGVAVTTRIERQRRTGGGGGGPPSGSGSSRKTWKTERMHFDTVPFAVDDGTGEVDVDPPGLDAFPTEESFEDSIRIETRTVRDEPHLVGTAPAEFDEYAFEGEPVADVDGDRRFEQGVVQTGDTVTVMGRVRQDEESGDLVVGHEHNPDAFTLSTEETGGTSATRQVLWAVVIGVLGLVTTGIGAVALLSVLPAVL